MKKADQKFKEGQKVIVIANTEGHRFEIGEVVTIVHANKDANNGRGDYRCSNGKGCWFLVDEELKLKHQL